MKTKLIATALAGAVTLFAQANANAATTYTQDTNLSNFTSGVAEYATFLSAGTYWTNEVAMGTAPTAATIAAGYRVVGDGNVNPIVVSFSNAVSNIRVFANMDHLGAAYDGYQYAIAGSNDNINFTQLFNATSVIGAGEPFTLGTYTGTAPTRVNNIPTGSYYNGVTGYIADFSFGSTYRYYSFGASTVAFNSGNADQELSAVAAVPEPETYAMMLAGLGLMGAIARRRKA